jgi:excinuclease ABC subunit A
LGNSIIIIEHNLDVIRNADWIIDLGPEGGEEGGRIVAQGTPEQVARMKKSYTGQALATYFAKALPGSRRDVAGSVSEPAVLS